MPLNGNEIQIPRQLAYERCHRTNFIKLVNDLDKKRTTQETHFQNDNIFTRTYVEIHKLCKTP